jgi:hypothetical protein
MMIWLKKLVLPPSYPSKHGGWIKKLIKLNESFKRGM